MKRDGNVNQPAYLRMSDVPTHRVSMACETKHKHHYTQRQHTPACDCSTLTDHRSRSAHGSSQRPPIQLDLPLQTRDRSVMRPVLQNRKARRQNRAKNRRARRQNRAKTRLHPYLPTSTPRCGPPAFQNRRGRRQNRDKTDRRATNGQDPSFILTFTPNTPPAGSRASQPSRGESSPLRDQLAAKTVPKPC